MALIEIHHVHFHGADSDAIENLKTVIMGKFDELTAEIQTLKTSVAEEKAEVKAKLDEQTAKIDQLQQTVNEGGTPEQITTLIGEVRTLNEEVKGIYTAPETGGEAGGETGEEVEGTTV